MGLASVEYTLVKQRRGEGLGMSLDEAVEAEMNRLRERYTWTPEAEQKNRELVRTTIQNRANGYTLEGVLKVSFTDRGSVVSVTIANVSNLKSSDIITEVFDGQVTLRYHNRDRHPILSAGDQRRQFCRLADMIVLGGHLPSDAKVVAKISGEDRLTTRYLWKRGQGLPYYTEIDRSRDDGRLLGARSYNLGPTLGRPVAVYRVTSWLTEDGERVPKTIEVDLGVGSPLAQYTLTRVRKGPEVPIDLSRHLNKGETVSDLRGGPDRQGRFEWTGSLPPVPSGGGRSPIEWGSAAPLLGVLVGGAVLIFGLRQRRNGTSSRQ
ncbi:hypothetical protein FCG40_02115 [Fimbriimonadia bacterium ATM]|nr:MAG: hypothetical protein EDM73_09370 [Armatimonadota bacterium]MBC6970446.1 hypothetical protein [Armatimonadota bacterium]MCE7899691.1 hypothetical protein [Armatimonadetes bacterium ATM1]MDL1927776.1 hypothetical protein [Fimbriimonadia bacterium ATM]RIJ95320.1 MAG: hypothetical protein DCC45_10255 [Armatimonadota bacterium]